MRVALRRLGMVGVLAVLFLAPAAPALAYDVAGWSVKTLPVNMPFWISEYSGPFDSDMPVGQGDDGRLVFIGQGADETERYVTVYDSRTGETQRIGPGDLSPSDPQIRGDHVAWVGTDGEDTEIFLHTLSTGEIRKLTNDSVDQESPRLSDHYLVWMSDPWGETTPLWAYDLTTGATKLVTEDLHSREYTLRGSWVTSPQYWSEEMSVHVYNLETGKATTPPALDRDTTLICDMGEGFVLTQAKNAQSSVFKYDLATGAVERISQGEAGGAAADPDGSRIAWSEWEQGVGARVFVRDLKTGQTQSISVPGAAVGTPTIRGGIVLWRAVPTGTEDFPVDRYYAHVLGQDTATQLLYAYGYGMPVLDGQNVYWPWAEGTLLDLGGYNDYDGPLVLRVATPPAGTLPSFVDVPGASPARTAVVSLAERGVLGGYPEAAGVAFRPDRPFLRAQFAKMLVETLDLPVDEALTTTFTDLGIDDPANLYPHEYVAAAVADGIVKGKSPTSFAPWEGVTRAQLVTMVVRAAEKRMPEYFTFLPWEPLTPSPGNFDPVHAPYLGKAERVGLTSDFAGYGPDWDPWQTATRQEGAELLWNLVELLEGQR